MYAGMTSPDQPEFTATEVHANVLKVLDRAWRFSKEFGSAREGHLRKTM